MPAAVGKQNLTFEIGARKQMNGSSIPGLNMHTFQYLIADLKASHGDNLSAVVLYGSSATGDRVKGHSDYNLLIALARITPKDLRAAYAPVREWQRFGNALPTYFTVEELREAADVFPIEFNQMARAHIVLYGADPFADLNISNANLRHQTEYELRSKLIQLRRLYIASGSSDGKLTALLRDSISSFATLAAPILILLGREPPTGKRDLLTALAQRLGLRANIFERVLDLRENRSIVLGAHDAHDLFASYIEEIEKIISAINDLS